MAFLDQAQLHNGHYAEPSLSSIEDTEHWVCSGVDGHNGFGSDWKGESSPSLTMEEVKPVVNIKKRNTLGNKGSRESQL